MIRCLLIEAIQRTRKGDSVSNQLARLANAWARLSQVDEQTVDIGLEALVEELKIIPEAAGLFRQIQGLVHTRKKAAAAGN